MITIDLKTTDERQGITHARGTIGGSWIFRHGIQELFTVPALHHWVASWGGWWRATFPGGLNRDGGDAILVMEMVNVRLNEAYPEG